jgi:hypothetical protein
MLDLSELFSIQANLLTQVPLPRSRFLNDKIDWNSRLLGIVGGSWTAFGLLALGDRL